MSKKIYGIPATTPFNPNKFGAVKTVNGTAPDENGNINVDVDTSDIEQDVLNLKQQVDYLLLGEIEISSLSISPSKAELGSTVNSLTATWSLNRDPVSQTFDGSEVDASERSINLSNLGLTDTKTFTLKATDEMGATKQKSATLSFMNGVYYGVLEDGIEIDSAAILTLTKSLQTARGITFTVNAAASQYIAYALPARYGTPNFRDADAEFPADFKLAKENYSFTNGSGYTEKYNIWLSSNKGLGSTRVAVS